MTPQKEPKDLSFNEPKGFFWVLFSAGSRVPPHQDHPDKLPILAMSQVTSHQAQVGLAAESQKMSKMSKRSL